MSVYKPFELEPLEYKEYVSPEALDEIHGLQNYVAALANIEIETGDAVYTQAAFDLAANQPNLIFQGIQDWVSFWGPHQAHTHQTVSQMPVAWHSIDNYIDWCFIDNYLELPRPSKPFRGACCAQHETTTALACTRCSHFSCVYHGESIDGQWVCGCCVWDDEATNPHVCLHDLGVRHGDTLHLACRLKGGAGPSDGGTGAPGTQIGAGSSGSGYAAPNGTAAANGSGEAIGGPLGAERVRGVGRAASSNEAGNGRAQSPTRHWEPACFSEWIERGPRTQFRTQARPIARTLLTRTGDLLERLEETLGQWATPPPEIARNPLKIVALFLESDVNWDPKSDVLIARILGVLFSKDLRCHSTGVYEYDHGAWLRAEELSIEKILEAELVLTRAQVLFNALSQGQVQRQWSSVFDYLTGFDFTGELSTPADPHLFNNPKHWTLHAGRATRDLPTRFTGTAHKGKALLDIFAAWFQIESAAHGAARSL